MVSVEALEDRVLLFSNHLSGEPNHEDITRLALPFLKDDVLEDVVAEDVSVDVQDLGGVLPGSSRHHFDNSLFSESSQYINSRYGEAIDDANPDDFDSDELTEDFGELLHTVQDFYAHSNWVNLGRSSLVDSGTGLWSVMTAYTEFQPGVMFVQGEDETPNVPGYGDATLALNSSNYAVTITVPGGKTFQGVISGSFGLTDDTPDNVAVSHGDLNKDDSTRTLFNQARALAIQQTEHEFVRLAELVRSRYGERGVDELVCQWVKPDRVSQDAARALVGGAALDLVFVIDTTGSMFDDIDAVKAAASEIINEISHEKPCTRIGLVLYKDAGDVYVTRTGLPFTMVGEEDGDTAPVVSAIQSISVGGGGDLPEAVYAGLVHAIENQQGLGSWRGGTTRKAIILMGDAPPHDPDRATGDTLATVTQKALDADPVDIDTVVVGNSGFIDPAARSTFQAIADANRGTAFNALSAGGIVDTLVEAIGDVIEPPASNHAPELASIGNRSVDEGSTLSFTASATDADAGQHLSFSLDPGAPAGASIDPISGVFTWTPPDGTATSSFNVSVRVTDDGSPSLSDFETFAVTVANLPPTADLTGPTGGVRGQARLFSLHAADPSPIDQAAGFTYQIDWDGDGMVDQTVAGPDGVQVSHTYTDVGTYTVRMTATDKDGGTSAAVDRTITIEVLAFQPDPADPTGTALVVGGTTGADSIVVNPGGGKNNIKVIINGASYVVSPPTGRVIVFGQAGDDDIQVAGGIGLSTLLYGDAGDDRIKGGNATNIMVGGEGGDALTGGNARDVLIGGSGADQLDGGPGDDLMVAGLTAYDADDAALIAVLAEWTSGRDFATRISNISGTGNGPRLNGNVFLRADDVDPMKVSVFDDLSADKLIGSSGQDWLFINPDQDKVTGAGQFITVAKKKS